ncbi:ATP-binding protein, partial [Streptomyces sp. NPDC059616]|uniref:ATP-binding protein n=1 Tax=Streptomyces sp. NPDC059616 TaxID=3346886 RepID=UPI0036A5E162
GGPGPPGARDRAPGGAGGGARGRGGPDTGAGIGPQDAAAVFDRGWSTHGTGRGIGLALVKQAVHRNGGTVTLDGGADGDTETGADGATDGGARFTVRLPLGVAGRTAHTTKEATA